jgi:gliding motility-associated-like protein
VKIKQLLSLIMITCLGFHSIGQDDVGTVLIISPSSGCQIGNLQVQADIFNFGDDLSPLTLEVSYQIDNNAPVTQTQIYATFNTNDTKTVTFTVQGNFGAPGDHVLKVYTDLGSDSDRSNDTLTRIVSNYPATIPGTLFKDTTICSGQSVSIFIDGNNGSVDHWEFSNDGGSTFFNLSNNDTFLLVSGINETRIYRAEVQSGTCPATYTNEVTVTVVQGSVAGVVEDDNSACGLFAEDSLFLKNFIGDVDKWQQNSGGSWMDIANTTDTLVVNNVSQTTSYRAIVTNGICPSDTSELATLTVIAQTKGGNLEADSLVCKDINNGILTLDDHLGNITWWERTTDDGVNWTPIINYDTSQVYNNLSQTTWYRVLVEADNCQSRYSDTVVVTVYQPTVSISANGPLDFCIGDSVDLIANPANYTTYTWNSGASTSQITVDSPGTFNVDIIDSNGCTASSNSLTVIVYELPIIEAGDDQDVSLGESAQLEVTGGDTYVWSPMETLDNEFSATPIATPFETTTYTVVGTDVNGCLNQDSVTVIVVKDYNFKPNNTITPNADGANDTWIIDNIYAYPEAKVVILNRYGSVVYEATAYQNDWAGTSADGQLPDGTYYYIITVPDPAVVFKGHINIFTK